MRWWTGQGFWAKLRASMMSQILFLITHFQALGSPSTSSRFELSAMDSRAAASSLRRSASNAPSSNFWALGQPPVSRLNRFVWTCLKGEIEGRELWVTMRLREMGGDSGSWKDNRIALASIKKIGAFYFLSLLFWGKLRRSCSVGRVYGAPTLERLPGAEEGGDDKASTAWILANSRPIIFWSSLLIKSHCAFIINYELSPILIRLPTTKHPNVTASRAPPMLLNKRLDPPLHHYSDIFRMKMEMHTPISNLLFLALSMALITGPAVSRTMGPVAPRSWSTSDLLSRVKLLVDPETPSCWDSVFQLQACTGEVLAFFLNGETHLGRSCCQAIRTIEHRCWPGLIMTLGFTREEGDILEGYCDTVVEPEGWWEELLIWMLTPEDGNQRLIPRSNKKRVSNKWCSDGYFAEGSFKRILNKNSPYSALRTQLGLFIYNTFLNFIRKWELWTFFTSEMRISSFPNYGKSKLEAFRKSTLNTTDVPATVKILNTTCEKLRSTWHLQMYDP